LTQLNPIEPYKEKENAPVQSISGSGAFAVSAGSVECAEGSSPADVGTGKNANPTHPGSNLV